MSIEQSRRRFLSQLGVAGVGGVGGLGGAWFGGGAGSLAAEPPPEITGIKLTKAPPITCIAPQYVAGELLRTEGSIDVQYETVSVNPALGVAHNKADWDTDFGPSLVAEIDRGAPLTIVAGLHLGCYELIAHDHVRSIADLKGRTVGSLPDDTTSKDLIALMAKFVGLDPDKDIHWVGDQTTDPMSLFVDRKIDAFLAVPPDTQELRARGIGHTLVNSATDRPWSHYFCCMLFSRTEFIQKYPAATKRIVRAFMKATDLCVSQPERVARLMVDRGFTTRYDFALEALQELPFAAWRDHDPEDTVRFFALRLNEAGYIKSDPQRIISQHTNWRFLNEVKRELKV
jgi:NitT/TauT family transport system substrate-binding protein